MLEPVRQVGADQLVQARVEEGQSLFGEPVPPLAALALVEEAPRVVPGVPVGARRKAVRLG